LFQLDGEGAGLQGVVAGGRVSGQGRERVWGVFMRVRLLRTRYYDHWHRDFILILSCVIRSSPWNLFMSFMIQMQIDCIKLLFQLRPRNILRLVQPQPSF